MRIDVADAAAAMAATGGAWTGLLACDDGSAVHFAGRDHAYLVIESSGSHTVLRFRDATARARWAWEERGWPFPAVAAGPQELGPAFERALAYAALVHGGHRRKGTHIPYLSHLLAVAALAIEAGADRDTAIAALLHDAPEDQGGEGRLDDIRVRFGARVAAIVDGCTDTFATPKPPWRERKERYLAHLRTAPCEVVLVSLADKLHNARAIERDHRLVGDALWRRFNAGADSGWYYRSLAEVYAGRCAGPLVDELGGIVAQIAWPAPAAGAGMPARVPGPDAPG